MGTKISIPQGVMKPRKKNSVTKNSSKGDSIQQNLNINDTRTSTTSLDPSLLCFNVHQKSASDRMMNVCTHMFM